MDEVKYAVIQCVNGNYAISSEHGDKDAAIIAFFNLAAALHNEPEVVTARVNLVDENLYVVDGRYTDWIDRREPEPPFPPEPETEEETAK